MRQPIYYFTCFIIVILSNLPYGELKFPMVDWSATEAPKKDGLQPHPGCEGFYKCIDGLRTMRKSYTTDNGSKCSEEMLHKECGQVVTNLHTINSTCLRLPQVMEILGDQYQRCRPDDLEVYCIDNVIRWINRLFTRCTDIVPVPEREDNCTLVWDEKEKEFDGTQEVESHANSIVEHKSQLIVYDGSGDYLVNIGTTLYHDGEQDFVLYAKHSGPINLTIQMCEPVESDCQIDRDITGSNNAIEMRIKTAYQKCKFPKLDKTKLPGVAVCRNGIWPGVNLTSTEEQVLLKIPKSREGCKMTVRISSANLSKCYMRWDTLFDIDLTGLPKDLDMEFGYSTDYSRVNTSRKTVGSTNTRMTGGANEKRVENVFGAKTEIDFNIPIDIVDLSGGVGYDFSSTTTKLKADDFTHTTDQIKKRDDGKAVTEQHDSISTLLPGYRHQKEVLAIYCTYSMARRVDQERSFIGNSFEERLAECGESYTFVVPYAKTSREPPPNEPQPGQPAADENQ